MAPLPSGLLTFLFTDIEGSTTSVQELGTDRWESVLEIHSRIIRDALATTGGVEVRTEGDAFFAVFTSPSAAIAAAAAAQHGLVAAAWPEGVPVRVRMGLHTGEARPASGAAAVDYVGFEIHRAARIAAAGHGGQVLVSETTESLVRDGLAPGLAFRDLGEHRFKDLARSQRVYQLLIDGLRDNYPPLRSLDSTPNNLPSQVTSFIGRERELAAALALFSTTRLLTLTGAGGSGKTRLALHLAADVLDRFSDGAWLVELAPVTDPAAVGPTVASVLRIPERTGRAATDTISAFLQGRDLLLVLDNCEHLIAACAALADVLIHSCPRLKILSTSREGLNVPGEALMPVPSLSVPLEDPLPPLDQLREYEAIRLFVDRTAYQSSFALTDDNAADVVRICRRLDGIPLAIELAAARVRSLSVAQVAQRLDDRFRLLTGGGRTVIARQQTLRALIDWSYDLLSDPERVLFRRLAVFVRGWTLEAAEAVCSGDGLARDAVLELLAQLVDKSLVAMHERGGMARYSLLETVREYAREKLVDSGEAPTLRQRHFDHFVAFAADGALAARRSGSPEFVRMAIEYENLRAALDWIRAEPDGSERELLLAGSMFGLVASLGRVAEFRRILEAALRRGDPAARTLGRARALFALGQLATMQGDRPTAQPAAAEAVRLLRTLGQQRDLADALFGLAVVGTGDAASSASAVSEARTVLEASGDTWGLGVLSCILADVALRHGDYAAARSGHIESLSLFREIGDLQWSASPLLSLGRIACVDGDYTRARALVEEAVAIRRRNEFDNHWSLAIALGSLGEIDRCEGNSRAAVPVFEEALGYGRTLSDEPIISWSIHNLGHVALQAHELATAAARFRESLVIRLRGGPGTNVAAGLAGLASVAARNGSLTQAAWLFGAVDTMLEAAHEVLAPADELVRQAELATIRAQLGPGAFDAALEAGRAATPEDIDKAAKRT